MPTVDNRYKWGQLLADFIHMHHRILLCTIVLLLVYRIFIRISLGCSQMFSMRVYEINFWNAFIFFRFWKNDFQLFVSLREIVLTNIYIEFLVKAENTNRMCENFPWNKIHILITFGTVSIQHTIHTMHENLSRI